MSNETPYGLSRYIEISKSKNLPRMMSMQNPYNLVNRTYEIGMSEISIREKCMAYSFTLQLEDCLASIGMVKCLKIQEWHSSKVGRDI